LQERLAKLAGGVAVLYVVLHLKWKRKRRKTELMMRYMLLELLKKELLLVVELLY
jgi:hypothetical protein